MAYNHATYLLNQSVKSQGLRWCSKCECLQAITLFGKPYRYCTPCQRKIERQQPNRKIREAKRNRERKQKMKISGTHTHQDWLDILERDRCCLACGSLDELTKDHIIPLALGGKNTRDNLQVLCVSCNSRKGKRIIDYRGKQ